MSERRLGEESPSLHWVGAKEIGMFNIGDSVWMRVRDTRDTKEVECPACKGHANRIIDGHKFWCEACGGVGTKKVEAITKHDPQMHTIDGILRFEGKRRPFGFAWDCAKPDETGKLVGTVYHLSNGVETANVYRTREEALMG